MSKVDDYKKAKRKAHRVITERASDGSGYVTHTTYTGDEKEPTGRDETGVHKSLHSVHSHMKDCLG